MNVLEHAFREAVKSAIDPTLTVSPAQQARIASRLYRWLSLETRKKAVPDLIARLERMKERIDALAEIIEIEYFGSGIVVKAFVRSDETFRMLRRGTDWFDPHPDLERDIIAKATS